jgi:hypothetical protein
MRTFLSFIICLILLLSSCKKDEVKDPGLIAGSWDWIYTWNDSAPGPNNPLTPLNSGIHENYVFHSDFTYEHTYYGLETEDPADASGTFSIGHGLYLPYVGAHKFEYDSIVYYDNGKAFKTDYYKILNDTLTFSTMFLGVSGSGSKAFVKKGSLN